MPHSTRSSRQNRSTTGTPVNSGGSRPVNGTKRSRREVVEEEEEEEEESEEEAPSRRRSRNQRERADRSPEQQSHRRRRDEQEESQEQDEEEEGVEVDAGEDDADDSDGGGNKLWGVKPLKKLLVSESIKRMVDEMDKETKDGLKRRANDLARLALNCEYKRIPLKRDEISRKILGREYSRLFPVVFNRAQKILRFTFGYEMVNLRARGTDNEQILQAQTQTQRRREQAEDDSKAGKAKGVSSNSYVLVSILPSEIIKKITQPSSILESVPDKSIPTKEGNVAGTTNVLLDWKRSESDLGKSGLMMVILGLILVSRRILAENQLRSYLRRMGLEGELPSYLQPFQQDGIAGRDQEKFTIDEFLTNMVKQDYLERTRSQNTSTNAASATLEQSMGKRRAQARGNVGKQKNGGDFDVQEEFEFRWGARAEVEFGEKAVANFVSDIFLGVEGRIGGRNGDAEEEEDEEENSEGGDQEGGHVERRKRRKLQIVRDVEKAAGSSLVA